MIAAIDQNSFEVELKLLRYPTIKILKFKNFFFFIYMRDIFWNLFMYEVSIRLWFGNCEIFSGRPMFIKNIY